MVILHPSICKFLFFHPNPQNILSNLLIFANGISDEKYLGIGIIVHRSAFPRAGCEILLTDLKHELIFDVLD